MSYEQDLKEFEEIAEILEIPYVKANIGLSVFHPQDVPETSDDIKQMERDGLLDNPKYSIERPAHSWLRNMYNLAAMWVISVNATDAVTFVDGSLNVKDTAGILRGGNGNVYPRADCFKQSTYGDDSTEGIWVGSGTTAQVMNDFALATQIAHGDGVNQLRHFDMFADERDWDGGTRQFTVYIRRYFTNHYSGTVNCREIGLVGEFTQYTWNGVAMVARDVLVSPIALAEHDLLRVEYTIVSSVFP